MKKSVFTILFFFVTLCVFSQQDNGKQNKFFAGGSFGLAFGRYTLINLDPQVGYRFNRLLGAGLGLNMVYASQKERLNGFDYSKTTQGIAGLNTFVRFYPLQRLMLQVQPEANYIFGNVKYYDTGMKYKLDTKIVPSILVGGGLVTPTEKGAALFTIMFDALQDKNSPYGNRPIVNVGYNFNF